MSPRSRTNTLANLRTLTAVVCGLAIMMTLLIGCGGKKPETPTKTPSSTAPSATPRPAATSPAQLAATPTRATASTSPTIAGKAIASPAAAATGSDAGPQEYIIEVKGDGKEVSVSVVSGSVTVADAGGAETIVGKGQQAQLPSGKIGAFNPGADSSATTGGIPFGTMLVDNDLPAAYDLYEPLFVNDQIPSDWAFEDPGNDATIKTPDPFTLVLTVPNGNDLWDRRSDAPRLMHRATGDFDLQGELLLQTKATDLAYVQFLVKAPGTKIGGLKGQMADIGDINDYLLLPSSWYAAGGKNRTGCVREEATCPENVSAFVHFRLTRRGDVFSTYWSWDGQRWNLHGRQSLVVPDTLWAGWLVKRMANEGLPKEPAVVTFKNISLNTAPPGILSDPTWDFDATDGVIVSPAQGAGTAEDNTVRLALDGKKLDYVRATLAEPVEGDFDVIVAYQTDITWKGIEGTHPDFELIAAHVDFSAATFKWDRYVFIGGRQEGKGPAMFDTNLNLGTTWVRRSSSKTPPPPAGKLRIIRQKEALSTYYLDGTKWVRLDEFKGSGFTEPATIGVQLLDSYQATKPTAMSAQFVVEQLATGERVQETVKSLTGTVAPVAPSVPAAPAPSSGVLFDDNFASQQASEAKGWTFKPNSPVNYTWSSNQFVTSVKTDPAILWGFAKGDYDDVGLEAEVQFPNKDGGVIGLSARFSEADNKRSYYEFGITDNGKYYLERMVNGISLNLAGPALSSLIKPPPERNTLGFLVIGSSLSLYINHTLVQTVTDTMIRAKGKAGFMAYVEPPSDKVALSRLTIYTPDRARESLSSAAAPSAGGSTPNAAVIDQEKQALAVHPGYKRFTTNYADFSVNIPDPWQSLAEEAKGRQIVLGSMGSQPNLEIRISAAGENLDQAITNWIQTMKGQVVVPVTKTAVGHYEARQAVVDVNDPSSRVYLAAVSAPNNTFLLAFGGPVSAPDVSVDFAAALASFRVPARCGAAVCPELLQRDAVVGTPAPPPMPAAAPATGGRAPATTPIPATQGAGGTFSVLTFAAGAAKDYKLLDAMTRFPEGVTQVFGVYTFEGMRDGTAMRAEWYLNGAEYLKNSSTWKGGEKGGGWERLYHPDGLPAGNYELRIYAADSLAQKGSFVVEKRPAGKPVIGRILFAENVKDDQPVNPHKPNQNFRAGTTLVYAFFDASNMSKSVSYKREWYHDGILLTTKTETWSGGASETNWWANYSNDKGLASGTYELKLYLDNELVQLGTFMIE